MFRESREKQEWSEDEIIELVGDVLDNQLQSRFTPVRSVLPQKLAPVQLDGTQSTAASRAVDGMSVVYDSAKDVAGFARSGMPWARVSTTTGTTNTHGTWTSVAFTTEQDSGLGMANASSNRIDIKEAGNYLVGCGARFDHVAADCVGLVRVLVNGSASVYYCYSGGGILAGAGFPDTPIQGVELIPNLAVDDYIDMDVYSYHASAGTPGNVLASSTDPTDLWAVMVSS